VAVVIGEPIEVDTNATSARDILHLTNDMMTRLEGAVLRAQELAGPKGFTRVGRRA
jgi:hypothetical protein